MYKEKPYLLIPIGSILFGLLLNAFDIPRPDIVAEISSFLIPLTSGLLGFSIGITLFVGRIHRYRREIFLIAIIKFVLSPPCMVPIALLLGLNDLMGGIPFKVLIIASAMPVAFNALIPPAIYGFDLDLANSTWVVTTFSYIFILPLLYTILRL